MADDQTMDLLQAEAYRQRYLADQIETSTPEQRLLMLFDRLLMDLDEAIEAFAEKNFESINSGLQHAQQVIFALRDPLDRSQPLGHALTSIYTFCLGRLVEANLRKDPQHLPEVRRMIQQIADANRAAAVAAANQSRSEDFQGVA